MSIDSSFAQADGYLLVTIAGEWISEAFSQVITDTGIEARKRGQTRILVDARSLGAPKSGFHRFLAGQDAAEHWRGIKAAVLYQASLINKFGENAAVNRGALLRVFPDMDEALGWLMDSP